MTDGSRRGYASRAATNLLLAVLCVTVAAGFLEIDLVLVTVLGLFTLFPVVLVLLYAGGHTASGRRRSGRDIE